MKQVYGEQLYRVRLDWEVLWNRLCILKQLYGEAPTTIFSIHEPTVSSSRDIYEATGKVVSLNNCQQRHSLDGSTYTATIRTLSMD